MERQRVLKRVSIRNRHSKYKSNPRVFDVVLIGKRVFFEVKTGKDQLERIPFEDVIEQVESAVLQEQHKNPCYERPYCVTGVIKLTGSKRAPKGICTDKDDGTRKGTELQLQ